MTAGARIPQVQHGVVDAGKDLEPFRKWLAIHGPDGTAPLAEKVSDEMTTEEAAGPTNHDTSGLIHRVLNPRPIVPRNWFVI